MAGLHCGLLLYLLPCLAQLTDQFGESSNCGTISIKCGTHAEIPCSADSNLTSATVVGPVNTSTSKTNPCLNMSPPTSQDGRLQLTWSVNTANLHINHVQHSDAGTYCFYLKTKDSSGVFYQADLQIEGPSEIPQISVGWMDMKIVCQATGGCPVGTIQWADGSGTNWTKSATSEEKNGVLTSTLLLQKSSVMAEYYCTVTYWHLDKTESQTRHIPKRQPIKKPGDPGDSEELNDAMYFLVAVAVLICALLVLGIYCRGRCVHQANDVLGQSSPLGPPVMDDIEMAAGAQSSETARLHSSPST